MDPRAALKHYIKMQLKHQVGMEEAHARREDLSIHELLGKTNFATLGDMRAEAAIEELLNAHPEAEGYYRSLYEEALAELREEHGT